MLTHLLCLPDDTIQRDYLRSMIVQIRFKFRSAIPWWRMGVRLCDNFAGLTVLSVYFLAAQ